MAENAVMVHQLPGRIRLRIPEKRRNSAYFSGLSEKLTGIDAIRNVKTNAATASVVIEFSGSLSLLIEQMQRHDVYIVIQQTPPEKLPARAPNGLAINTFTIVTGRDINPLFMIGSLFAFIGVVQTLRGKILVPSLSAFWYAMGAFRYSGKGRIPVDPD